MSDLGELRAQIDAADREILALFVRRLRIADRIAEYKRANSLPVYDAAREGEKLRAAEETVPEDMRACAAELIREMMRISRERQLGTPTSGTEDK